MKYIIIIQSGDLVTRSSCCLITILSVLTLTHIHVDQTEGFSYCFVYLCVSIY